MDTKEYISSGILESYAMGFCSDQERREVECLSSIYPEIKEELNLIFASQEEFALQNSVDLPEEMEDKIWSTLNSIEHNDKDNPIKEDQNNNIISNTTETPIVQLYPKKSILSVAAVILFLISSSLLVYFMLSNQGIKSSLNQTLAEKQILKNEATKQRDSLSKLKNQLEIIALPTTQKVILAGVPSKPLAKAAVFYNEEKKAVILTGLELPKAPEGKQYQLWALLDGKPIDAGVFDLVSKNDLLEMKKIDKSQAFAITLEPVGGSPTPHLEDLCVIGNL